MKRKDKVNLGLRLPVVLWEMVKERVSDSGFLDTNTPVLFIIKALIKSKTGEELNFLEHSVLRFKQPDRMSIFKNQKYLNVGFHLTKELNAEIVSAGFTMNHIFRVAILTFLACGKSEQNKMSAQLNRLTPAVIDKSLSKNFGTFLSEKQYNQIDKIRSRTGENMSSFLRSTIDLVLSSEGFYGETVFIPRDVAVSLQKQIRRKGFIRNHFQRDRYVATCLITEERKKAVRMVIMKYKIPGIVEFLRRVLLFLLESPKISYTYHIEETNISDDFFDEYEQDIYSSYVTRDFMLNEFRYTRCLS